MNRLILRLFAQVMPLLLGLAILHPSLLAQDRTGATVPPAPSGASEPQKIDAIERAKQIRDQILKEREKLSAIIKAPPKEADKPVEAIEKPKEVVGRPTDAVIVKSDPVKAMGTPTKSGTIKPREPVPTAPATAVTNEQPNAPANVANEPAAAVVEEPVESAAVVEEVEKAEPPAQTTRAETMATAPDKGWARYAIWAAIAGLAAAVAWAIKSMMAPKLEVRCSLGEVQTPPVQDLSILDKPIDQPDITLRVHLPDVDARAPDGLIIIS